MTNSRYTVVENAPGVSGTHMVVDQEGGRILGAFGTNFHRSWVYPLYSPSGYTVVREFAFDHPFHNGVFVGQNPVCLGDITGNFWAIPVRRSDDDHIRHNVGRMDPQGQPEFRIDEYGVLFTLRSTWVSEHGDPMLDEVRVVRFQGIEGANICEISSAKTATYSDIAFPKTKFGSIGMRVEERLLPVLGGEVVGILGADIRRGSADEAANGKPCDFVAYENQPVGLDRYGVAMTILENSASEDRTGPWFIRDYGMAMFNATHERAIRLQQYETWTAALRIVAYDGAIDTSRAQEWSEI